MTGENVSQLLETAHLGKAGHCTESRVSRNTVISTSFDVEGYQIITVGQLVVSEQEVGQLRTKRQQLVTITPH